MSAWQITLLIKLNTNLSLNKLLFKILQQFIVTLKIWKLIVLVICWSNFYCVNGFLIIKHHLFTGLCIKSQEVGTDLKVFVNICTTDAIPSPKDITETELQEIIDSEDAATFR